jgi:hypothetical protein
MHDRSRLEFPPDHRLDMRITRKHGPIGMEQGDCGAGPEHNRRQEPLEIGRIDAPRHHAEEGSIRRVQPMRNYCGPSPCERVTGRLDDHCRRVWIGFEALEKGPVGDTDRWHRKGVGGIDELPVCIEEGDVADKSRHVDLGAQHLVRLCGRGLLAECVGRDDLGQAHLRDQPGGHDLAILEQLIKMAREELDHVFQLALAVGECALAEFAYRHDGADDDRRNKQDAADDQPDNGVAASRRGDLRPSCCRGSGRSTPNL